MRTLLMTLLALAAFAIQSCSKHAEDYVPTYGTVENTWTFFDGFKNYFGTFTSNPVLHTTPQANNTYRLELSGREKTSGEILNMAISVPDLNLRTNTFQSGISGSDHETSFNFTGSVSSRDPIYFSTNLDPGAVMTYKIVSYDAGKKQVVIEFSGDAFDVNGKVYKITKGKITASITFK
jgi:hypothetical protein